MALITTPPEQPKYRQRLGYQAGLLGGVCFLVSILLIMGNKSTSELIQSHLLADKLAMLSQVLPAENYDNNPLATTQTFTDISPFSSAINITMATLKETLTGRTLETSIGGWGGDIQFILAVDNRNTITGVRVISHKETPGLADKIEIEKDAWITQFNGKSLLNLSKNDWAVKKDGGVFDQFTGATITPRALVKGVHLSLQFLDDTPVTSASNNKP